VTHGIGSDRGHRDVNAALPRSTIGATSAGLLT
jgi:hypothetical protein